MPKLSAASLSTDQAIDFFIAVLRDILASPTCHIAVAMTTTDTDQPIQGICILTIPSASPATTKTQRHIDAFHSQFSWLYRLRLAKLDLMRLGDQNHTQHPAHAYLKFLSVSSRSRGLGLGQLLLNWADRCVLTEGCTSISLHVSTENRAKALYERHGYQMMQCAYSADGFLTRWVCWVLFGCWGFHYVRKELTPSS